MSAVYAADGTATSSSCVSSSGWNEHSARATTAGGRARSPARVFFLRFSSRASAASSFSFASRNAKAVLAFAPSFFFPGDFAAAGSSRGEEALAFAARASSSSSSELASGAENFHTTSSPLELPAASTCDRPDFAVAMEVTAPFFTSIVALFRSSFPPNARATRTARQYRRSAASAARCACEGGGGSAKTPRFATPLLGGGCILALASASAARRCFSSAAATRRFSTAASESESESLELEPLELEPLSDELASASSPRGSRGRSPEAFGVAASFVSLNPLLASAPRAIPGGGDAGRSGCVWWNTRPGGRRRCISLSMCWHACLPTAVSYAKPSSSSDELVDQHSSEELPTSAARRARKSIVSSPFSGIAARSSRGFEPPKRDHRVFLRAAFLAATAASRAAFFAFAFAAFSAFAFSFAAFAAAFSAGVFELHSHPPDFFRAAPFSPARLPVSGGGGGAQGLSSAAASPSRRAITAPAMALATKPAAAAWFASTSRTTPIASSRATSRTSASSVWRHIATRRDPALRVHSRFSNASFSLVGRSARTSATPPHSSSASSRHICSTVFTAGSRVSSRRAAYSASPACVVESFSSRFSPSRSSFSYDAALSRYLSRAATEECASFMRSSRSFARVGTNAVTFCLGFTPSSFCRRRTSASRSPCARASFATSGSANGDGAAAEEDAEEDSEPASHGFGRTRRGAIARVGRNASC